jgi:hypothetical protein
MTLFPKTGVENPLIYVVAGAFCWALLDRDLSVVPSKLSIVLREWECYSKI